VADSIQKRIKDVAISVREAAIKLVSNYILKLPVLVPQYFPLLLERMQVWFFDFFLKKNEKIKKKCLPKRILDWVFEKLQWNVLKTFVFNNLKVFQSI